MITLLLQSPLLLNEGMSDGEEFGAGTHTRQVYNGTSAE
jgi:hypothetical protein